METVTIGHIEKVKKLSSQGIGYLFHGSNQSHLWLGVCRSLWNGSLWVWGIYSMVVIITFMTVHVEKSKEWPSRSVGDLTGFHRNTLPCDRIFLYTLQFAFFYECRQNVNYEYSDSFKGEVSRRFPSNHCIL